MRGIRLERGAVGRAGGCGRVRRGQKPAGKVDEFPVFGRVRDEQGLEDGNAVHLLFPDDGPHAVVGGDEFAFDPRGVEDFRAVAEERLVLLEKGADDAVRVIGGKFREGFRRQSRPRRWFRSENRSER